MKYYKTTLKICFIILLIVTDTTAKPTKVQCPEKIKNLPIDTICWNGQDKEGAYYWVIKPKNWNRNLILYAHGGPKLSKIKLKNVTKDFKHWSVWVRNGYAWAGTSYSIKGFEVINATKDIARLLPIASSLIGKTKKIILHGQSWGASVAARAAEVDSSFFKILPKVDALFLTNGVLGGASKSYDFRMDLRVVWQEVCHNHPRTNEIQYPLWQGLPKNAKRLKKEDIQERVNECLGLNLPRILRSSKQIEKLNTILNVIKIKEESIRKHLSWATNHFQDIIWNRLDGKNPFTNEFVKYIGSNNDELLNKNILRYKSDSDTLAKFSKDGNPTGNINMPILTLRAIHDPTVFVQLASTWKDTVTKVGKSENLLQVFTNDNVHGNLGDIQYISSMNALLKWINTKEKPKVLEILKQCKVLYNNGEINGECNILPKYVPAPLSKVVPKR